MKFISLTITIMFAMIAGLLTAVTSQSLIGHPCAHAGEYSCSVACFACTDMRLRTYGSLQAIRSAGLSKILTTAIPFCFFVDRTAQSSAFKHVAVLHAVSLAPAVVLAFALKSQPLLGEFVTSHVRPGVDVFAFTGKWNNQLRQGHL